MHENLSAISKNIVTGSAIIIGALLTEKAISNTKEFFRKRRNKWNCFKTWNAYKKSNLKEEKKFV